MWQSCLYLVLGVWNCCVVFFFELFWSSVCVCNCLEERTLDSSQTFVVTSKTWLVTQLAFFLWTDFLCGSIVERAKIITMFFWFFHFSLVKPCRRFNCSLKDKAVRFATNLTHTRWGSSAVTSNRNSLSSLEFLDFVSLLSLGFIERLACYGRWIHWHCHVLLQSWTIIAAHKLWTRTFFLHLPFVLR